MEKISVNGEEYVKASSIARELGYTSDYVGQLCRSGAVASTMVGRTWYVDEDSLRKHKKNRYRSSVSKTQAELKRSISNNLAGDRFGAQNSPNHSQSSLKTDYESDESELVPLLRRLETGQAGHVTPSASEVETVDSSEKRIQRSLTAEGQPVPLTRINTPKKELKKRTTRLNENYREEYSDPKILYKDAKKLENPPMVRPQNSLMLLVTTAMLALIMAFSLLTVQIELLADSSQVSTAYSADVHELNRLLTDLLLQFRQIF